METHLDSATLPPVTITISNNDVDFIIRYVTFAVSFLASQNMLVFIHGTIDCVKKKFPCLCSRNHMMPKNTRLIDNLFTFFNPFAEFLIEAVAFPMI